MTKTLSKTDTKVKMKEPIFTRLAAILISRRMTILLTLAVYLALAGISVLLYFLLRDILFRFLCLLAFCS